MCMVHIIYISNFHIRAVGNAGDSYDLNIFYSMEIMLAVSLVKEAKMFFCQIPTE